MTRICCNEQYKVGDCVDANAVEAAAHPRWRASQRNLPEIRLVRVPRDPLTDQHGRNPHDEDADVQKPSALTQRSLPAENSSYVRNEAQDESERAKHKKRVDDCLHVFASG